MFVPLNILIKLFMYIDIIIKLFMVTNVSGTSPKFSLLIDTITNNTYSLNVNVK